MFRSAELTELSINGAELSFVFRMPQNPFAFEFECEQPNDLCMAELPFGYSEIFTPFLLNDNLARHFKIKNIYIFDCE